MRAAGKTVIIPEDDPNVYKQALHKKSVKVKFFFEIEQTFVHFDFQIIINHLIFTRINWVENVFKFETFLKLYLLSLHFKNTKLNTINTRKNFKMNTLLRLRIL